jgi:hypothetical protein
MLEGRFAGAEAEHARMVITRCPAGVRVIIDLAEIVFIDTIGEEVLSFFARFGAEFLAPTSYALDVCDRLRLPLFRSPSSSADKRDRSAANDPRFAERPESQQE